MRRESALQSLFRPVFLLFINSIAFDDKRNIVTEMVGESEAILRGIINAILELNYKVQMRSCACVTRLDSRRKASCNGQQPFYTDDADVTKKGKFLLEFRNEFDVLQRASYPSLRQNTADLSFALFLIGER
jgi:hypothetical protein